MRILMLTDFYRPVVGGLERHVELLAECLTGTGHRVDVVTLAVPGATRDEVTGGVRIHRLTGWSRMLRRAYADPMRPFHPPVADPGVSRQLRRLVRRLQPDVVHAHSWMLYSQLPNTSPDGPPLVVTLHDYGVVCPRKDYMYRGDGPCSGPAYRKCVSCAATRYGPLKSLALTTGHAFAAGGHHRIARCIAVSRAVADAVTPAFGDAGPPVEIIPPFITDDLSSRANAVQRPQFLPASGYLLFVGNPAPHKGFPVMLEAHRRLVPATPLVVIGTRPVPLGPDTPDVITAALVPHDQILAAFRDCTVAVAPSVWQDPMPLVAIEASACGAPVVASNVGGLRDIVVSGETGLLVPPGDPNALTSALQRLLSDGVTRLRMGAAGRRRSRAFAASAIVPRIEAAYRSALRRRER